MKKHCILALILILAMPCMAQLTIRPKHGGHHQQSTTLTVLAPRGLQLWLYVDDMLQNEQPSHSIRITNMGDDSYYVRVELDNQLQNCVGQFVDLRQSQTLVVTKSGQYFGLEPSQAHVRPEVTMNLITQQPSFPETPNVNPPMPPVPTMGMSPHDYDDAYQLISSESFDSSKLTIAKQVVASNPMTANQILGICKLFSFESNKLEFAKYAYAYCVDPNKYFLLNEAFTYDSSKQELNEFVSGQ